MGVMQNNQTAYELQHRQIRVGTFFPNGSTSVDTN
jgi:hypothetical protein